VSWAYHGNELAGALKRGQTRAFGLLLPFLSLPFWSDVAAGAEEMAHAYGYSLILLEAFHAYNVAVPGDCAIISHDGLPATAISTPSLTTIAPPSRAMGRAAIDVLLRAQSGDATPSARLLEAELVVRESTIGSSLGSRGRELKATISHPAAWSLWRDQLKTESVPSPGPPVASVTLDEWARMEGSTVARQDPPRTDPMPV
jgi:hypothetical protein